VDPESGPDSYMTSRISTIPATIHTVIHYNIQPPLIYLKGHEMVCQPWPLVVSLGLNNQPRTGFTLVKSGITNIHGAANRGTVDCKMADTSLKCVPVPRIVTKKIILPVPRIVTKKIIVPRDCHSQ
jgi:hypothetical protein